MDDGWGRATRPPPPPAYVTGMPFRAGPPPPDGRPLPPPPSRRGGLDITWPAPIRRFATFVAIGCVAWSVVVLLASVLAPKAVASVGMGLVAPAFIAMFLPFAIVATEQNGRRHTQSLGLHGWRSALVAVAGLIFAGLFIANLVGSGKGTPIEEDGRYYLRNGGVMTPISQEEYRERQLPGVRLFAGAPLVFAGIAVLVLTRPAPDGADEPRPAWWPHRASVGTDTGWRRARGFRTVSLDAPGTLEEVLARLRSTIPITAEVGASVTSAEIEATWRPSLQRGTDVFLEGSLDQTLHGTTRAEIELGMVSKMITWVVLPALWGSIFIVLGFGLIIGALTSNDHQGAAVFGVIWTAMATAITVINTTTAWRVGRMAADQVSAALEGRPPKVSQWKSLFPSGSYGG